jgi:hypothetical protein
VVEGVNGGGRIGFLNALHARGIKRRRDSVVGILPALLSEVHHMEAAIDGLEGLGVTLPDLLGKILGSDDEHFGTDENVAPLHLSREGMSVSPNLDRSAKGLAVDVVDIVHDNDLLVVVVGPPEKREHEKGTQKNTRYQMVQDFW